MHLIKRKNFWVFKENFAFEYFLEFEKNYCYFRNQYPQIFQYSKFHAKIKNTFTTKRCFIWIFSGWNSKKSLSYLKLTPSNKFGAKIKILKFSTKNAWCGYFWARILKNYCHIWNQHPRICLIAKFHEKMKMPKFGTKNALFGYFWTGIWKEHCHIWNKRPWICLVAKFGAKLKILKFGIKNTWFGSFWTGIWKQYCHISNQHPRICLYTKCREKVKMPKFGTKSYLPLFGYFWVKIFKKYCHIWNQHPWICLIGKFCEKKKNAWIWEQKCLIWVFLSQTFKKLLSYLKSALSNWSNCKILWNNENG